MDKHKLLYVDEMQPDRRKGLVDKRDKIMFNMELIDPKMAAYFTEAIVEHKQGSLVLIAGRYICIVTMGLEKGEGMIILDLENKEEKMKALENSLTNEKLNEKARLAFEAIRNTPTGYYDYELHVGELPAPM